MNGFGVGSRVAGGVGQSGWYDGGDGGWGGEAGFCGGNGLH